MAASENYTIIKMSVFSNKSVIYVFKKKIVDIFHKIRKNRNPYLLYIRSYLSYVIKKVRLTKKSKINHNIISKYEEQVKCFKHELYQFSYVHTDSVGIFINTYLNEPVIPIKILPLPSKNEPILLCLVKNDIERIKLQVEYHRKIGIKHFAYIDNISDDGTFEWLKKQGDISLFVANGIYNNVKQRAWNRQVTDIFGYDRWYLMLDSDELFMYPGVEKKKMNDFVIFLEMNKINNVFSPIIDMYSDDKLFAEDENSHDIFSKYCYFDTDTYKKAKSCSRYIVNGGPRARLFLEKNDSFRWALEKYALVKLSKEMMIGAHQNYPYKYSFGTNGAIAFLLHYQFLPGDHEKYKAFIVSKIHVNGSEGYKKYMDKFEQNPNLSFYYSGSQKLKNSMDLLKINIADKIFLGKFVDDS